MLFNILKAAETNECFNLLVLHLSRLYLRRDKSFLNQNIIRFNFEAGSCMLWFCILMVQELILTL